MVKTLKNSLLSERFRRKPASSAQQTIPIDKVFEDGIWKVNRKFSRTWQFSDINYAVGSEADKAAMREGYFDILNRLPSGAASKLTIFNRRMDKRAFAKSVLISECEDGLDHYRDEINGIILSGAVQGNGIIRDKYITIACDKRSIKDARPFFNRVGNDLVQSFGRLSSEIKPLELENRLKVIHDFFRIGEESDFDFDLNTLMKRGADFKDMVCPYAVSFKPGYFTIGEKYGRVLFLRDYSSYISDEMISEFTDLPIDMMLSIDILPVPTDEAVKEMQKQILVVESNVARWQRRQNANNNFNAIVPYEMEQMRGVAHEYLDDLTSRDQRLMFGLVTLVHLADSKQQLDIDTETMQAIAQKSVCTLSNLYAQQEPGLNTVLPYGIRPLETVRTLTTESTGILIPFKCQEIMDTGGMYYGQSVQSQNPIICDRSKLQNPHAWILGVSGSGKSLMAKFLIAQIILSTDADVLVLDPEFEYSPLIKALGGVSIDISASSKNHINALDINRDYGGDENPIIAKCDFVLSLCETIMHPHIITAKEKSIIDRCTREVYEKYGEAFKGKPPTFKDFYDVLLQQPQPEAMDIALAIELFTTGSLNVFSKATNVDTSNRIISYNLNRLGKQLRDVGMLVTLDSLLNRVSANRASGKQTYIFCDEMDIFYKNEYSGQFFASAWKRFRKYNAPLTGISQHASEMLQSELASTMLQGSELVVLLNNAAEDREKLGELLRIPDTQLSNITNAEAGHGLIRVGKSIVPFANVIPGELDLYKLISTKPGES